MFQSLPTRVCKLLHNKWCIHTSVCRGRGMQTWHTHIHNYVWHFRGSPHTINNGSASTWHIDVLALLWLVAHLNGQVGWVSLHLLSLLLLLLPCCWPLPFWTCFDTVPSPCMEGGSSPASQEGLGQPRGAAQLTTSQLSSAPLKSLVHHCMHHCTDCTGRQWQRQHKWQDDWQDSHCHCGLAGTCSKQEYRIQVPLKCLYIMPKAFKR